MRTKGPGLLAPPGPREGVRALAGPFRDAYVFAWAGADRPRSTQEVRIQLPEISGFLGTEVEKGSGPESKLASTRGGQRMQTW